LKRSADGTADLAVGWEQQYSLNARASHAINPWTAEVRIVAVSEAWYLGVSEFAPGTFYR